MIFTKRIDTFLSGGIVSIRSISTLWVQEPQTKENDIIDKDF